MAKFLARVEERGIQVFMINWNIFTSPVFSKAHSVLEYSQHLEKGYNGYGDYSDLVQQYNKDAGNRMDTLPLKDSGRQTTMNTVPNL